MENIVGKYWGQSQRRSPEERKNSPSLHSLGSEISSTFSHSSELISVESDDEIENYKTRGGVTTNNRTKNSSGELPDSPTVPLSKRLR